ncbi:MAG: hypothetical protein M1514_02690 [Patescibacteria group bacterium]|nr:hypothetical protein [Patescibacteria group bacterium]
MKKIRWSPTIAYAVGLIATDGNLSKDGRHITFTSFESELLKSFKRCLHLKSKIFSSSFRIQFSDVSLYRWLLEIGITPAKTYTLGKIDIPDEYFRDFLRGHLDGDGTILTYVDKYNSYKGKVYTNQRIYTKFISVSENHARWLHAKIKKLAKVKGALNCNVPKSKNKVSVWVVKFAKKESLLLLNWLYYRPQLPCLKRKKEIFMKFLNEFT